MQHIAKQKADNTAVFNITVVNDDNFLSPYCINGKRQLDESDTSLLNNTTKIAKPTNKIKLIISSKTIDDNEKQEYTEAIHQHYYNMYCDKVRDLKQNTYACLIMFFIAVITLSIVTAFKILEYSTLVIEIIDIFAWVFMWGAVELGIIQRIQKVSQLHRYKNLSECQIEYIDIK